MTSLIDIRNDAPGLLRTEAMTVTLKFERTGPTTGRISWNIPRPAQGCAAGQQAYNGIVVTFDTTSASTSTMPVNGTIYTADNSIDPDLFAGDALGTSRVVGAFYNDLYTTYVDITGLTEQMPCYVSGYPVDAQNRYYREGVHAYSTNYTLEGTEPTRGTQVVVLNPRGGTTGGVQPTDITGLRGGTEYSFTIQRGLVPKPNRPLGDQECVPSPWKYTIVVDGDEASTYSELIDNINKQLQLIDNPTQGNQSPNTGSMYVDVKSNKVYVWNGTSHDECAVICQSTPPNTVTDGTYWLNGSTLYLRTNSSWTIVKQIDYNTDPANPLCDNTAYWFNGTSAFTWSGVVWEPHTIYRGDVDPSLFKPAPCGSYWYNTTDYTVNKWDDVTLTWQPVPTAVYEKDPRLTSAGEYWYNTVDNRLREYKQTTGWEVVTSARVTETEPTVGVTDGTLWLNPADLTLVEWTGSVWAPKDVAVYHADPTTALVWWNNQSDKLYAYDVITRTWVLVTNFWQQTIDPTLPPDMVNGDVWLDDAGALRYWDNACFKPANVLVYPTDPRTTLTNGTVWHDNVNDVWYERAVGVWVPFSPTISNTDPTVLPVGTIWLQQPVGLSVWNGISWTTVAYTTKPLTPKTGTKWYNNTTNRLMEWDGYNWVYSTPLITLEYNCYNNFIFSDTNAGSLSWVSVTDIDLFASLTDGYNINLPNPGTDGVSSEPSYQEIGVGTDGSNDQRLKLMMDIRYALGYPTVDVELQNEQLNYAIDVAIQTLRENSSAAYSRGFFFLQINSETQRYLLTNKVSGMNKIVDVLGVHRLTSSFLSSAHGAGVYGQIVMQNLYNMGTFDLLSYHIMSEYTKTMEMLFAGRVTYTWNEQSRELWLHHRFPFSERLVLVDAAVERTEQQLLSDRNAGPWIRKYAIAEAMMILANTRGKFASLPGAGGSVSLNASDLRQQAITDKESCMAEITDFVLDYPEEWGLQSTFTMG